MILTTAKKNMILLLSFLCCAACACLIIPHTRLLFLALVEQRLVHKGLNRRYWVNFLVHNSFLLISAVLMADFCIFCKQGKKVISEIKNCLSKIRYASLVKPLAFLTAVYILGLVSIIRADFLYVDDVHRAVDGSRWWYQAGRHLADYLSIIVHGNIRISDISPLPQLLAAFLLALSGVLGVYIFTDGKCPLFSLIASLPLGLSPYFLHCLSYKFDAPYMALSVLASVIPFLFLQSQPAFIFVSFVSVLAMCMTYQASSGIYILFVILLCFRNWNYKKETATAILRFAVTAAVVFISAMIFYFVFLAPNSWFGIGEEPYRTNMALPLNRIIPGFAANVMMYAGSINQDFGIVWKILICIMIFCFVFISVRDSSQRRLLAFFVTLLAALASFVFSFGSYLALEYPSPPPRALYGFGAFIALISICSLFRSRKPVIIAVIALNWSFLVFSLAYGNALSDQKRYTDFRAGILLTDLHHLFPDTDINNLSIQLENAVGFTPIVDNTAKRYPVIKRMIPGSDATGDFNFFFFLYLTEYHRWGTRYIEHDKTGEDFSAYNLPLVLDGYYHTIRSDGKRVLILLKGNGASG